MADETEKLLDIFKALSCKARFDIVVGLIQANECNVTKMSEKLNIPQPNVSQHLNILKKADIIKGYRKGSQICYKVTNEKVRKIIEVMEVKIDIS
jgi:ArsR family transcriptional regulator